MMIMFIQNGYVYENSFFIFIRLNPIRHVSFLLLMLFIHELSSTVNSLENVSEILSTRG